MLSITFFLTVFVACLFGMKISKRPAIRYAALFSFTLLIVECCIYGFFLLQIYKGTCFFLIGNQKMLDTLIKIRLTYSNYYAQGKKSFIHRVDDALGYTLGTDKEAGGHKTNKQGFRADKEYSLIPLKDKLRVAAFGDSFVYGHGEANKDTWESQLENMAGNIEVLNFGVPGYGLGQSYLRLLQDGLQFNPDILFFNYVLAGPRDRLIPAEILNNGNLRMAHFYRVRFWTEDGLLLSDSLTPFDLFDRQFRQEHLYKPLGMNENIPFWGSKLFSITNIGLLAKQTAYRRIFSKFHVKPEYTLHDEEINIHILNQLVYIATINDIKLIFFYESPLKDLPKSVQKILLKNKSHVVYVDSGSAPHSPYISQGESRARLLNSSSHWNAEGNRYYAKAVLEVLKERRWGVGNRRFRYLPSRNSF